jgi:arginase
LAVKIARQEKNIALLGAPVSAAALTAGHERAPAALREAGLVRRLTEAGFTITDYGDCARRIFVSDEEHPRARNVAQVLATLEELRPKVEVAIKSGGLPVMLGGDTSIVLATIAGARRYYRNVSLIFMDRDADLKEPATTPSGSVEGMVISHVLGRGAPELVRFWGEPPLVRAPDVALFGIGEPNGAELEFMAGSPLRRYLAHDVRRLGATAAAEAALERVHGRQQQFVLHLDLNVIDPEDFRAATPAVPGGARSGGLRLSELREALAVFARQPTLAALEISSYNPSLDPDGEAAKELIELIVEILARRLEKPAEVLPPSEYAEAPVIPSVVATDIGGGAASAASAAGSPATNPAANSAGGEREPETTATTRESAEEVAPREKVPPETNIESPSTAPSSVENSPATGTPAGNTSVEGTSVQNGGPDAGITSTENTSVESGSPESPSRDGNAPVETPGSGPERETPDS